MKNKLTSTRGFISIELILVAAIMLTIGYVTVSNFQTVSTQSMNKKITNLEGYLKSTEIIIFTNTDNEEEPTVIVPIGHVITLDDGLTLSNIGWLRGPYSSIFDKIIIPAKIGNSSILEIQQDTFSKRNLTEVIFSPDSQITRIHARAFADNLLTEIEFPLALSRIDLLSFKSNKIEKVVLPESLTIIEQNAFLKNNITSITIGSKVTTIGTNAFGDNHKGFIEAYSAGGAGTYLYTNGRWVKQ